MSKIIKRSKNLEKSLKSQKITFFFKYGNLENIYFYPPKKFPSSPVHSVSEYRVGGIHWAWWTDGGQTEILVSNIGYLLIKNRPLSSLRSGLNWQRRTSSEHVHWASLNENESSKCATDTLCHCATDTLCHWHTVPLTHCALTHWQTDTMCTDTLLHWHAVPLTHCATETLCHCATDTLTHIFIGSLTCSRCMYLTNCAT